MSESLKKAFIKSLPVLCSYIFLGIAYGIMMEESGFAWYITGLMSITVYTGAFQFVFITLASTSASLLTIAVTALLMNSRQAFYGLTYAEDFNKMKKRRWYMIHSLTDETYAVNSTIGEEPDRHDVMFYVAIFSQSYWVVGSLLGSILGQLIPFKMEGIDFSMTALFIIIFIDNWEKHKDHRPALIGLLAALGCLFIFGTQFFMLPALLIASAVLILIPADKEVKSDAT